MPQLSGPSGLVLVMFLVFLLRYDLLFMRLAVHLSSARFGGIGHSHVLAGDGETGNKLLQVFALA